MESVGIIIIARNTNNILLLHRVKQPIVWSSLSGKMEKGENPIQTIKREIKEEIGIDPTLIDNIEVLGKNGIHYVVVGYVDEQFKINNLRKEKYNNWGKSH
jgi:ADP-ribose pyrophosphatase YjhB (NUDIX family)